MNRFWTCLWQFRFWRLDINRKGQPVASSGSTNDFFTSEGKHYVTCLSLHAAYPESHG
jgi:hypothetical protein